MIAVDGESGFSLLEILVVLAIIGVLLSVGGTFIIGSVESVRFSQTADESVSDILAHRNEAFLRGKTHYIINHQNFIEERDSAKIVYWNTPVGWKVTGDVIRITDQGLCIVGGRVNIEDLNGRMAIYDIQTPTCRIKKL